MDDSVANLPKVVTPAINPKRILIPIAFVPSDVDSLLLGMELALFRNADLTVLHVLPDESEPTLHWLDAIDRMYAAIDGDRPAENEDASRASLERTRKRIRDVIGSVLPKAVREVVQVHTEVRYGLIGDSIARCANEIDAMMIVLSSEMTHRWKFLFPRTIHRVAELTPCQIVLAQPVRAKRRPLSVPNLHQPAEWQAQAPSTTAVH